MPDERGYPSLVEIGEFVLATYREIAAHFHLKGPNAARTKTKRAGWTAEPTNHPADPLRIRVPRDVWSNAAEARPPKRSAPDRDAASQQDERPALTERDAPSPTLETQHLRALEEHISTLREGVAAERTARVTTETQRDQALADLRTEREQRAADAERMQGVLNQAWVDLRSERARAERAEAGRDGERGRADAVQDRLEEAQDELRQVRDATDEARRHAREAEDAIEALRRADDARRARGRLRRAWDGWRGR